MRGPTPLTLYHHLSMYRNYPHHPNGLGSNLLRSLMVMARCNSRVLAPSRSGNPFCLSASVLMLPLLLCFEAPPVRSRQRGQQKSLLCSRQVHQPPSNCYISEQMNVASHPAQEAPKTCPARFACHAQRYCLDTRLIPSYFSSDHLR
jgi:hypothetical protein